MQRYSRSASGHWWLFNYHDFNLEISLLNDFNFQPKQKNSCLTIWSAKLFKSKITISLKEVQLSRCKNLKLQIHLFDPVFVKEYSHGNDMITYQSFWIKGTILKGKVHNFNFGCSTRY